MATDRRGHNLLAWLADAMRPSVLIWAVVSFIVVIVAVLWHEEALDIARRVGTKAGAVEAISTVGPVAVVALMALAVVASPIPSGPIAMAAGALYGAWTGGALTVAGAFLGAMIAFGLSRRFGYGALSGSSRPLALWITRPRSQWMLTLLVMATRLIPAISFDAVSYVAGLTRIDAWRFAIATLVGVTPISFAFAAMGAGLAHGESRLLAIVACGITLLLPAGVLIWRRVRTRIAGDGGAAR